MCALNKLLEKANRQLFLPLTYKDGQRDSIPKVKPRHLDCPPWHAIWRVCIQDIFAILQENEKLSHYSIKFYQSFDVER